MFGKEDCPPPAHTPVETARSGEIYTGKDWKPGPIDWSGVPTKPTEEARQAAMNFVLPKEVPRSKGCVGGLKDTTRTGRILIFVFFLLPFAIIGVISWHFHEEAREDSLNKHNVAFYNQTHSNATGILTPPPPTYVPRFWEEHSTHIPNTGRPSSLGFTASATPVSHTTFMTRTRALASEVSTTHTSSN